MVPSNGDDHLPNAKTDRILSWLNTIPATPLPVRSGRVPGSDDASREPEAETSTRCDASPTLGGTLDDIQTLLNDDGTTHAIHYGEDTTQNANQAVASSHETVPPALEDDIDPAELLRLIDELPDIAMQLQRGFESPTTDATTLQSPAVTADETLGPLSTDTGMLDPLEGTEMAISFGQWPCSSIGRTLPAMTDQWPYVLNAAASTDGLLSGNPCGGLYQNVYAGDAPGAPTGTPSWNMLEPVVQDVRHTESKMRGHTITQGDEYSSNGMSAADSGSPIAVTSPRSFYETNDEIIKTATHSARSLLVHRPRDDFSAARATRVAYNSRVSPLVHSTTRDVRKLYTHLEDPDRHSRVWKSHRGGWPIGRDKTTRQPLRPPKGPPKKPVRADHLTSPDRAHQCGARAGCVDEGVPVPRPRLRIRREMHILRRRPHAYGPRLGFREKLRVQGLWATLCRPERSQGGPPPA